MNDEHSDGWDESAAGWLAEVADGGDYGRKFVLDAPMLARIKGRGFKTALDVGCGEGRFCRMLRDENIKTVGIDPTQELLATARELDPDGDYRLGRAEDLDVPANSFDLVVCYLTLIDIAGLSCATERMVNALRPGGTLLIANLTSFSTAGMDGWTKDGDGSASVSTTISMRAPNGSVGAAFVSRTGIARSAITCRSSWNTG
jgi:SAM-dependent methyltransferase